MLVDYPQYTWSKKIGGSKKDPINLVFSNTTLEKILNDLELSGWSRCNHNLLCFVSTQFTPDEPLREPQDAQSVKGQFWDRYHARFWSHMGKSYVGSAHYETLTLARGHDPHSFESGKHEVQDDLQNTSWEIEQDKHDLENYTRKKFGSGKATEFTEVEQS